MFERNTSTALVSEIISVVPKVSSSQHEGENEVAALQIQEEADACNLIKPKRREWEWHKKREKKMDWVVWNNGMLVFSGSLTMLLLNFHHPQYFSIGLLPHESFHSVWRIRSYFIHSNNFPLEF